MNTRSVFKAMVWVGLMSSASTDLAAEGIWTKKGDIPTARGGLSPTSPVVDGKIYVIGGAYGTTIYSLLEVYDPATDVWTRRADMPTARWGLGTCALNGKIYAIGGVPGYSGPACAIVEEYDPATDTWARKADTPTKRVGFALCAAGGRIYVLGGGPSEPFDSAISTVEAYDPVTNAWTRRANMPSPRAYFSAEAVNGRIYVIGGTYASPWPGISTVDVYDPATDTWTATSPMPTARWWHATGIVGDRIYAIGGTQANPWSGHSATECYDPAADIWTKEPSMPTPRLSLSVAAIEARIYAIGGFAVPYPWLTSVSTVEVCDLMSPPPDFNGDGQVDIKDLLQLIESWGQADPIADIAPIPFGDGKTDAADLEMLMGYWGQEVDDPTLIAHWKLDETEGTVAADSVGANDGALVGDAIWQPTGGKIAGALEFDGVDDCVTTEFVRDPSEGPFSVLAWVKGGKPGQVLISQVDGVIWLMADPSQGALMTELAPPAGRKAIPPLVSDAAITDGAWHRVGFTWDGQTRVLYVDDIEVALDTQASLAGCSGGLNIGCGKDMAPGTFWSGLIDDVRIYDRAVKP